MQRMIIFIFMAWLIAGCQPKKSANEMMAEKNKALMAQMYEAFNADDWNKASTIIAADFVEHNPEPGQKPGLDGLKEIFAKYRSAFPDMKFTADKMISEGDIVVAHIVVTETNKGEFMGMPATGKTINVEGYDMVRFANGKGVEHWGVYDMMGMMQQLGMMPPPGAHPPEEKMNMKKK